MGKFDKLSDASLSAKLLKLFKVRNNNTGVDPANCDWVCNYQF